MRRDSKFLPQACGVEDMNPVTLNKYITVHQNKRPEWPQRQLCRTNDGGHKTVPAEAESEDREDCEAGVRTGLWAELIPVPLPLGSHRRPQNVKTLNPRCSLISPTAVTKCLTKTAQGRGD